jgi:predicted dehydrogenase
MGKKIYRAGIIGCGFIANIKHLPAIKKLKDRIDIAALCDVKIERAQEAAEKYGADGCKIYTDYKKMLEDVSLDIIYVLTPNRWHMQLTIDALRSGKHVMCEKPMACTSEEANKMCETAAETGKLLAVGYQYRCRPESLHLKKIAESGDLGEIYFAQAHAIRRRGIPNWGVFLNKEEQGGGALIDIGTHALDLTLWTMDNYKPKMVLGKTYNKLGTRTPAGNKFGAWDVKAFGDVEDFAFGTIIMENGATITLEASWALNTLDTREQKITLCGTKAGADMDDGLRINGVEHGELYDKKPVIVKPKFEAEPGPEDAEANNWLQALDGEAELRVKPEQALVVTQILEAIYKSAKTGKPVEF